MAGPGPPRGPSRLSGGRRRAGPPSPRPVAGKVSHPGHPRPRCLLLCPRPATPSELRPLSASRRRVSLGLTGDLPPC